MGGGDKGLLPLGGVTLIERVIERLAPQCAGLAINANGDPARFARFGLPVVADPLPDFPGPLTGVLAGLELAAEEGTDAVVTAAADTPFLPRDLVARLQDAACPNSVAIALAASPDEGGMMRRHPTFGLWRTSLREDLRAALLGGQRRVAAWADRHGAATAPFPAGSCDPFFNVNTPEDLMRAEAILAAGAA